MMRGDLEMSDVRLTDAEAPRRQRRCVPWHPRHLDSLPIHRDRPARTRPSQPASPPPSPVHLQAARFARLSALAPTVSPPRPRVARPVPRRRVPRGALPRRVRHHPASSSSRSSSSSPSPSPPPPRPHLRRRHDRPSSTPPSTLQSLGAVAADEPTGLDRDQSAPAARAREATQRTQSAPWTVAAAALNLGVLHPHASGIGGGAFAVVRLANGTSERRIPHETAPSRGDAEHVRGLSQRRASLEGGLKAAAAGRRRRFTVYAWRGSDTARPIVGASRTSRGDARGAFDRGSRTRARHRRKTPRRSLVNATLAATFRSLGPSLPDSRRRHVRQPRARANASRHRDRRCRRASNGSPRGGVGARRARGWHLDGG